MLRPNCDLYTRNDRTKFSRAKGCMEFIRKLVNEANFLPPGVDNVYELTEVSCVSVFDKVFQFLHDEGNFFQQAIPTSEIRARAKELCYGTMYNDKVKYEITKGTRQKRVRRNGGVAAGNV